MYIYILAGANHMCRALRIHTRPASHFPPRCSLACAHLSDLYVSTAPIHQAKARGTSHIAVLSLRHVACVTVIVEASAPQGRAPSRRPHPCHPFVVLRFVPAPPRATSAARPRPPLSLPQLRGSGSRLGRAEVRGGAEPRARATAVGTAHALGRGPSRIRSNPIRPAMGDRSSRP